MRIATLCANQVRNQRHDHWITAKCEGRAMINVGFGLSLLGHEVDIFCEEFEERENIWGNVSLFNFWNHKKQYDFIIAFNPHPGSFRGDNYKKMFYLRHGETPDKFPQDKILHEYPKTVSICTPAFSGKQLEVQNSLVPIEHFPLLMPIPCYEKLTRQGFQDFNFHKENKTIKILSVISTWCIDSGWYAKTDKILDVLTILKDEFSYDIELTIILNDDSEKSSGAINSIIKRFNPTIAMNRSLCYKDMLDLIWDSDLCIIKGDPTHPGNSSVDILGFGKPILYIVSGTPNEMSLNRIQRDRPDLTIHDSLSREQTIKKIGSFLDDPESHYNGMAELWVENSFPVWRSEVANLLSRYS